MGDLNINVGGPQDNARQNIEMNIEQRTEPHKATDKQLSSRDGEGISRSDNQESSAATPLNNNADAAGLEFDVFLCHNSADKPAVRKIGKQLAKEGIIYWLDEDQLRPGFPWQEALEEQIESIHAAAVFVGESGFGPWQDRELRAFLDEFVERKCPVIPVILPGCRGTPKLPPFLRGLTWVDFRETGDAALRNLVWGITGRKPG